MNQLYCKMQMHLLYQLMVCNSSLSLASLNCTCNTYIHLQLGRVMTQQTSLLFSSACISGTLLSMLLKVKNRIVECKKPWEKS